jgi:hypothetical protein
MRGVVKNLNVQFASASGLGSAVARGNAAYMRGRRRRRRRDTTLLRAAVASIWRSPSASGRQSGTSVYYRSEKGREIVLTLDGFESSLISSHEVFKIDHGCAGIMCSDELGIRVDSRDSLEREREKTRTASVRLPRAEAGSSSSRPMRAARRVRRQTAVEKSAPVDR